MRQEIYPSSLIRTWSEKDSRADETRKIFGEAKEGGGEEKNFGYSKWENGEGKKLGGCEKRSFGRHCEEFLAKQRLIFRNGRNDNITDSVLLVSVFTPPNYVIHGCIAREMGGSAFSPRKKGREIPKKRHELLFG